MTPSAQIKLQLLSKESADAFAIRARQIVDQMRSLSLLYAAVYAQALLLRESTVDWEAGTNRHVLVIAIPRELLVSKTTP
jgi:hypothetical protein